MGTWAAPFQVWPAERALIYDPSADRQLHAEKIGVAVAKSPVELAAKADILVLAVKPQTMAEALAEIKPHLKPGVLIVSIAAGISTDYYLHRLGEGVRVVRVMPNTPCMAHAGAAGISLGANALPADAELVKSLFDTIGIAEIIDEKHMDALTALSGSGPAYFFYLVECLTDAAIDEGMDAHVARRLAEQTLYGAGRLLHSSEDNAAVLREKVTSRGGVTEAALRQFREDGLPDMVRRAIRAAVDRSAALGQ
jgi:pyrroline-5-carboxylate reductase